MSLQAPQQIRLRRRPSERQVHLLYLPHNNPSDNDANDSNVVSHRRVFRLVKQDGGLPIGTPTLPPTLDDAPPEPQRYILSDSGPSKKRKIATFVAERPLKRLQVQNNDQSSAPSAPDALVASVEPPLATPSRKRPGASTALKRTTVKSTDPVSQAQETIPTNDHAPFKGLLEEAESHDVAAAANSRPAVKHRFLPKATTRLKDRTKQATGHPIDVMDADGDSEMDYVYDMYILDDTVDHDLNAAAPGSIGLLHIEEDQQPIWDTYLDETDSEDERNSDDEDSNAEDYYGADYPEDELDSDDEYNVDAYKYRRGASDDEEYGSDEPAYSDAGDEPAWIRHGQ